MAKAYKLGKTADGLNVRDRETDALVGTVSNSDGHWYVELFGQDFNVKSKEKALGIVRGMFAARAMVNDVFPSTNGL